MHAEPALCNHISEILNIFNIQIFKHTLEGGMYEAFVYPVKFFKDKSERKVSTGHYYLSACWCQMVIKQRRPVKLLRAPW